MLAAPSTVECLPRNWEPCPPPPPPPPTHAGCAHREHFIYVRGARASVSIAACLALPRVPPRLGKHTGRQWQRDCHGPVHAAASALSIPRTAHPTYSFYVKLVTGMRTGAHKSRRSGRCAELPGPADRSTKVQGGKDGCQKSPARQRRLLSSPNAIHTTGR